MSWFPRPVGPRAAFQDLRTFLRQREREHVIGAALAFLATVIVLILFFADSKINTAAPPQVVYVENYGPDRTDADIIADQKKDQAAKEAARAERQLQFQKLGNQLGIE